MKKSSAVISMLLILSVIAMFFIPKRTVAYREQFDIANILIRQQTDNKFGTNWSVPAELPMNAKFDTELQTKRDFDCEIKCDPTSGYYSSPFVLHITCDYDIYYTVDGTIPDSFSLKYDNNIGIPVNETTFLCICAENNGKLSDIYYASYVIFSDHTNYRFAYGYNSLSEDEKNLYEIIYSNCLSFNPEVEIGNRNFDSVTVQKVLGCVDSDNPLLFQIPSYYRVWKGNKNNVTYIRLDYEFTKDECERYREATIKRVDEMLKLFDSLNIKCLMDYLDNIHYEILNDTVYDDSNLDNLNIYEAFGVLTEHKGVCESYSRAFQYLCQRIGLESLLVVGISNGNVGHMWNMVNIENEWYHIDLTWDDCEGYIVYDFFNVDEYTITVNGDRVISPTLSSYDPENDDELFFNYYPIPSAVSDKYNFGMYYYGNNDQSYYIVDGQYSDAVA